MTKQQTSMKTNVLKYAFIFFVFLFICLQPLFISYVYGVDFSCPGGYWVTVQDISYPPHYGFALLCTCSEGGTKTFYYGACCGNSGTCASRGYTDWMQYDSLCAGEGSYCNLASGSFGCVARIITKEWHCPCTNGQTQSCYSGASETKGVGICQGGTQTCTNGQWGECQGEVLPTEEVCGDNLDNNCNGEIDEGCDKILKYISGKGQEGLICETLKNPFVVAVSDASQNSANVNWQITDMPSEATGSSISNQVAEMTGSDITSSAYLKLGNLPGSYTTEARCGECTSGSPQTFTATAKCPEVPVYYQNDYSQEAYDNICKFIDNTKKPPVTTKVTTCQFDAKTGKLLPGYTQWKIRDKGCALTSIAMVIGQYGIQYAPDALNKTVGYTSRGEVLWRAVESMTGQSGEKLKYIFDQTHFGNIAKKINIQKSLMDKYLDKCIPVIAKVFNQITNNPHWVVVTGQKGTDYTINDPANRFSLLSQYGDIYDIRVYKNQKGGCQ